MSEREDNSGLLDYLLEKNEIYDNFQDNAENSSTGFLRTKDSKGESAGAHCVMGTAWVYRDENGKQIFEKQLTEDDITSDHLQIPKRMAHYIQSLELQRADPGEKYWEMDLQLDNWGDRECQFTGQWKDFVNENKSKAKDLVVIEIFNNKKRLKIGCTSDQKAINLNNPIFLRRLSRADVKGLYVQKLREQYSYSGNTGLIEIEPVIEMKLCSEIVYRYGGTNGVMFIQLPKKEVEKNLGRDLSLPAVGGEIALPLFDPVGNNVVEMKLVHTEKDEYHIGGEWEIYAAKYDLLMSDTIFLDKVTVHRDHDQKLNNPSTAKLSYHYEITYQRRRGTKDQSSLAAAAATVLDDAGNNNIKDNGVNSCIML
ncbi:uncharacterized protein [Nicotiana tomentosiformis]|uniref:uncharacterized protein n=1 Tax=Nicotiana tomentosiformis TaxID=4098 RepID=UPI00051BA2BF